MTAKEWSYLVFGGVLFIALIFDLGLLSKKGKEVSIRQALIMTLFWVTLAIGYGAFVWFEDSHQEALEYLSAYFMEWGLSLDNIFVFILLFSFFRIPDKYSNRLLLYGILLAIVLRVIFITIGIALIDRFHWILYIFGVILLYTGIRMFTSKSENEVDINKNVIYRMMKRILPLTEERNGEKFIIKINGRRYFTTFFVALVVLAGTDIIFALDSIPAVFAITQDKMAIYTSNIFAVLGLRSLFFLLKGAVNRFEYLHQGIAFVLIFIGLKMLADLVDIEISIGISLAVILLFIGGSVIFSIYKNRKKQSDS